MPYLRATACKTSIATLNHYGDRLLRRDRCLSYIIIELTANNEGKAAITDYNEDSPAQDL